MRDKLHEEEMLEQQVCCTKNDIFGLPIYDIPVNLQFSVYILYFHQSIAPPTHASHSIPTPSYVIYTERQRA